jgi:hypothetical protein
VGGSIVFSALFLVLLLGTQKKNKKNKIPQRETINHYWGNYELRSKEELKNFKINKKLSGKRIRRLRLAGITIKRRI